MPDDVVREAAEFIARERDPHTQTKVVFMGGEPTSRFASIRSVIERLEEGIGGPNADLLRFDITSNGTLLTEEMVRYFSSHNVMVLLSVDGARESHNAKRIFVGGGGSFDALRQGIQLLKRYQGYLGTKMTPTPETASALLEDVKAVVGMGFRRILIGPATGVPWDEEALAVLRTSLASVIKWKQGITLPGLYVSLDEGGEETALCGQDNRWGCRAGRTGLAIDIDGSLSPCSKIIGTSNPGGAVLRLGTVYEGVTNNATRLKLNGYTPTERVRCWSCDLRTACHGGCYAANVEATGNPFEPAPFNCKVTEAVLQAQRDAREK